MIGIGIGVYFSLPAEPPGWLAPIAPAIAIGATVAARRKPVFLIFALSATCVAVGLSVSIWRTAAVEAPLLERRIGPAFVSGRVEAVEPRPNGVRVTVGDVSVTRLEAIKTPRRVRMTMKGRQPDIRPGMRMEVVAILPPPPPSAPGAFDFQRQSYFRGLGAVGFSVGTAKLLSDSAAPWPGHGAALAHAAQPEPSSDSRSAPRLGQGTAQSTHSRKHFPSRAAFFALGPRRTTARTRRRTGYGWVLWFGV